MGATAIEETKLNGKEPPSSSIDIECKQALKLAHAAFNRGKTRPLEFRRKQLRALSKLLADNKDMLVTALRHDMGKPRNETILTEIVYVQNDIAGALMSLKKWASPEYIERRIVFMFDRAYSYHQPLGVVLIVGAWNYPIQLLLSPLVGAIAAGNCAVLKPSEYAPATARAFFHLLPQYLDEECFHLIQGGPKEMEEILQHRFDHIFFTGSFNVGQIIHSAANRHLIPTTLELGGKSPLYIDDSVKDLPTACRRILWAKFLNAGQTCAAPDYILCTRPLQARLVDTARAILLEFYGSDPHNSPDLGRIISDKHFKRLVRLLQSGSVAIGGDHNMEDRYIAPTILADVTPADPIMQEEVFGPILPIVPIAGLEEAVSLINSREKPLTLYVFTERNDVVEKFKSQTFSGSVCVNDAVVQVSIDELPFGGVGYSGMGRYHGKYTFETFSHKRAVFHRNYNFIGKNVEQPRFPPSSEFKLQYLSNLIRKQPSYWPMSLESTGLLLLGLFLGILLAIIFGQLVWR